MWKVHTEKGAMFFTVRKDGEITRWCVTYVIAVKLCRQLNESGD